jgi:hypothetical protein
MFNPKWLCKKKTFSGLRRRATDEFSPASQGREGVTESPPVALATIESKFSRR